MITLNDFFTLIAQPNLLRSNGIRLDPSQQDVVQGQQTESFSLVAGSGRGKTTALALQVLKFVFVEAIDPGTILATNSIRKAATELRSRILGWGDKLRQELIRIRPVRQTQQESQGQLLTASWQANPINATCAVYDFEPIV
jgi:DNA helicase-2/ATP-dependent DNA helicase PcrA